MTSPLPDPGCPTNWPAYNVPRLWAMVADEDNPETWRQIAALGDMADTVKDQKNRLRIARDALTEAWPPEKNPAARAFVDQIDILLRNMEVQRTTAEKNAAALGHIAEALRQAKDKIKPLYEQYLQKSDDRVPRWWDKAEDELDQQARKHMADAEKVISTHAVQITAPPPYRLEPAHIEGASTAERPPDADPKASSASAHSPLSRGDALPSRSVPHDPPPPLPAGQANEPPGSAAPRTPGIGLAEVVSPPTGGSQTGTRSLPAPGPASAVGPAQPGWLIGGGVAGPRGDTGSMSRAGSVGGPLRGMPSAGAVIGPMPNRGSIVGRGGVPNVKPVPPAWLPPAPTQPGAIGGMGTPRGTATGQTPRGGATMAATPTVGGRGMPDEQKQLIFDPDHPWATAVGVDPVIEPSRKQIRHDPGPSVIGWQG